MELDNYSISLLIMVVLIGITVGIGLLILDHFIVENEFCDSRGGIIIPSNATCEWQNSIRSKCQPDRCLINGSIFDL